jgi:hypothetical protein
MWGDDSFLHNDVNVARASKEGTIRACFYNSPVMNQKDHQSTSDRREVWTEKRGSRTIYF